jgi:hypothetical protein
MPAAKPRTRSRPNTRGGRRPDRRRTAGSGFPNARRWGTASDVPRRRPGLQPGGSEETCERREFRGSRHAVEKQRGRFKNWGRQGDVLPTLVPRGVSHLSEASPDFSQGFEAKTSRCCIQWGSRLKRRGGVLSVRRAPLIERTPLGAAYWRLQPETCEKVGLGVSGEWHGGVGTTVHHRQQWWRGLPARGWRIASEVRAPQRAQGRCCRGRSSGTRVAEPVIAEEVATYRRPKGNRRNDWLRVPWASAAPHRRFAAFVHLGARESRAPLSA